MDIKLTFLVTFVSGDQKAQEITIPADPRHPFETQAKVLMQTMMQQYAATGYVMSDPEDKNHYILITPSQIARVDCTLPSILIAHENEVPKVTLD